MTVDALYPSDEDLERYDETARSLILAKAQAAERGDYNKIVLLAREAEERLERPDLYEAPVRKAGQTGKRMVAPPDRFGGTPVVDPEGPHAFMAHAKEPSKCAVCGHGLGHNSHWEPNPTYKAEEAEGQRLLHEELAKAAGDDRITVGSIRALQPRLGTAYAQLLRLAQAWATSNGLLGDDESLLEKYLNSPAGKRALATWPQAQALLVTEAPSATQKAAPSLPEKGWRTTLTGERVWTGPGMPVAKAEAHCDACAAAGQRAGHAFDVHAGA